MLVVFFSRKHNTHGCMAMITCSQAARLGVDGGCSLNIRINDHTGQSSETSFILLLHSNAMQANNSNKDNIWRSEKYKLFVFLASDQIQRCMP